MENSSGNFGDGGEVDEDQDESSSSNKTESSSTVLEEFRKEWKREIEQSPRHGAGYKSNGIDPIPQTVEDKAKVFFRSGVECENAGKMYEAIQFYRRAVQLVPDIDLRTSTPEEENAHSEDEVEGLEEEVSETDYAPGTDLLIYLLQGASSGRDKFALCTPVVPPNGTHISDLPVEIFLYILRWVVSSDLDFRSLEMIARVCRGFYICARDQEIWRLACYRVWGPSAGLGSCYQSWREMWVHRPRLSFEGCYISKTTYIRHGENSFQDQYYRPWHLVQYFRYLRFFPDGRVLSLTTPEEPIQSVGLLRSRVPPPRLPPVYVGCYQLDGSTVSVVLRPGPSRGKGNSNNQSTSTFHLELEVCSTKKRLHSQLVWRGYSVFTHRNGVDSNTPFELHPTRYPPFWFSRVKSYTSEANRPLCK